MIEHDKNFCFECGITLNRQYRIVQINGTFNLVKKEKNCKIRDGKMNLHIIPLYR